MIDYIIKLFEYIWIYLNISEYHVVSGAEVFTADSGPAPVAFSPPASQAELWLKDQTWPDRECFLCQTSSDIVRLHKRQPLGFSFLFQVHVARGKFYLSSHQACRTRLPGAGRRRDDGAKALEELSTRWSPLWRPVRTSSHFYALSLLCTSTLMILIKIYSNWKCVSCSTQRQALTFWFADRWLQTAAQEDPLGPRHLTLEGHSRASAWPESNPKNFDGASWICAYLCKGLTFDMWPNLAKIGSESVDSTGQHPMYCGISSAGFCDTETDDGDDLL